MWARITRVTGASPEQFDAAMDWLDTTLRPALSDMDGYAGVVNVVAGDRSMSTVISLWDSEEAMNRSSAAVEPLRAEAVDLLRGTIASVESGEVAFTDALRG